MKRTGLVVAFLAFGLGNLLLGAWLGYRSAPERVVYDTGAVFEAAECKDYLGDVELERDALLDQVAALTLALDLDVRP